MVFHMNILKFSIIAITLFTFSPNALVIERSSDREIIESLSAIRGDMKAMAERFKAIDRRFEDVDKRFDDLYHRYPI